MQICFPAKSKYVLSMGMTENTLDKGNLRAEEQEEKQLYSARTQRQARLLCFV